MATAGSARTTPFRCQSCLQDLAVSPMNGGAPSCAQCGVSVGSDASVLNFVMDPTLRAESEHYDSEYANWRGPPPVEATALEALWRGNPWAPFNQTIIDAMGDLEGATVVCLGNGLSSKELYFLEEGTKTLVVSDLSENAPRALARTFPAAAAREDLWLCAIDAQQLPFADGSVSVVYGYAFVHHLPDIDRFLGEVSRVLAPGGRAVFMDNHYSPIWQAAKTGPLRRVMHASHKVSPISAEDERYTIAGGFQPTDIARRAHAVGCDAWFRPTGTIHYLVTRASQILSKRWPSLNLDRRSWVLTPDGRHELVLGHRRKLELLQRLDSALERFGWARANRMRLVWGITKPR